MAVLN